MAPALPSPFQERFNITEYFLDRPARAHPNKTAILGTAGFFSYAELAGQANRVGNALLRDAIGPGDRVLIVLPDSAEFIAAFFGAAKIGAIPVPVNAMSRSADFTYYLDDCGARIAIVDVSAWAEFSRIGKSLSKTKIVLAGEERLDHEDTPRFESKMSPRRWAEWLESTSESLAAAPTKPSDTAFFLYTSGSGGAPKAAVHRHKDMLVTSRGFASGVLGLHAADITFSVSKLFFAYGLGNGMYFPFSMGAATVLNPQKTKVDRVIAIVTEYRPTVFFAVATFYGALLQAADDGAAIDFSSVRLAVSAGEALPAAIFAKFRGRFGIEILDGIGSTEMLHMFLSSPPGKARPGSCGFPVPGYEAKIVDETAQEVSPGEIGNLWVKGESAFTGYWNKPELTERTRREGNWIVTGDKFTRDYDGYYHYCGRADDMLKVAGMWVSPTEVENVLLEHPHVAEAAVVGLPDTNGLTYEVAYIVPTGALNESPAMARDICDFVKVRLLPYKCPREVRFCRELPKTATGKIQRFKLRDRPASA